MNDEDEDDDDDEDEDDVQRSHYTRYAQGAGAILNLLGPEDARLWLQLLRERGLRAGEDHEDEDDEGGGGDEEEDKESEENER
jgi:hypothetical protein